MRYFALVLCGFLAACCVKQPKEYTVIREVSRPVKAPVVQKVEERAMVEPVVVAEPAVPTGFDYASIPRCVNGMLFSNR